MRHSVRLVLQQVLSNMRSQPGWAATGTVAPMLAVMASATATSANPTTGQSHRPHARRSILPLTRLGCARPGLERLARPALHTRNQPAPRRHPPPTPPIRHQPRSRHQPTRQHRYNRRLESPQEPTPRPELHPNLRRHLASARNGQSQIVDGPQRRIARHCCGP